MDITITKKIAKQGKNLVLILPKNIQHFFQHGELVQVKINQIEVRK